MFELLDGLVGGSLAVRESIQTIIELEGEKGSKEGEELGKG